MPQYHFLHVPTSRSWPTDDPHAWLLDHRDEDLLAAAREGLVDTPNDPDRCLRTLLRRCRLVLVQIVAENKIVVQHWANHIPDLRRWAKENGFNRPAVQVVFVNVKNNNVIVHEDAEDVLLFGVRVGPKFPWSEHAAKYECRHAEEPSDEDTAPAAFTNFGWPSVAASRLPWKILKAVWNAERVACPNCDRPLVLTSFGWHQGPLSFRSARVFRHCTVCRRRIEADEPEPLAWVASVLPSGLRPTHLEQWRKFEIDWSRLAFKHHRPVQFADREG